VTAACAAILAALAGKMSALGRDEEVETCHSQGNCGKQGTKGMDAIKSNQIAEPRNAPLEMSPEEFRALGYRLVDQVAEFLGSLPKQRVSPGESPREVRAALGDARLPEHGSAPEALMEEAVRLLVGHSLFNGHPRFMGFITSPAAPLGVLGDLLAAAINPNCGGWVLSPMATEIEAQTIRWIAEMIGYPREAAGILVTGGTMANFVAFLAARKAQITWDARTHGLAGDGARRLRVYASTETHTWLHKAVDLFGMGLDSIAWISANSNQQINTNELRERITTDKGQGDLPFMLIGTAGTVSTGAVDPLPELASIAREHGLWFHVDGAYGGFAAVAPDAPADLRGMSEADSVAVDPHKWLYAPLDAGCTLVRDRTALRDAFTPYRPSYYKLLQDAEEAVNFFENGPENSRGFRALKIWLALRQVGREGYAQMIGDDIRLAKTLFELATAHPELQAFRQGLSIATFRYVPSDLKPGDEKVEEYLNQLNSELMVRLQKSGEAFLTNAVIGGSFVLRACIVNFRTSLADIRALPGIITRLGAELDAALRPEPLSGKRAEATKSSI
jgi:glutamate/tyrosine decarboxylase-like PLP-dependent enzyme